jgi:hypothetical protein
VAGPEFEVERLVAVPGGIKLLTTGRADTDVVHDGMLTIRRLGALAHDDLFDQQIVGRRTEVGLNCWLV